MKKYIILMVLMMLLISIIHVSGVDVTYETTFEDGTLGLDYSNNWMTTDDQDYAPDEFEISNTQVFSGSKSFGMSNADAGSLGRWKYTYDVGRSFTSWHTHFYSTGSHRLNIYIYNRTASTITDTDSVFNWEIDESNNKIQYDDYNGVEQDAHSFSSNTWHKLELKIIDNSTVHYILDDVVHVGTPRNTSFDYLKYNLDTVYFTYSGGYSATYFDNHKIGFSESDTIYSEPPYEQIGSLEGDMVACGTFDYLEHRRENPLKGSLKQFEMLMRYNNDETKLTLCINGHDLGIADAVYENYISISNIWCKLLVWENLDRYPHIVYDFEKLEWEVYYSGSDSYCIIVGRENEDLDGDSISTLFQHNTGNYCDGVGYTSGRPYDPCYRAWFLSTGVYVFDDTIALAQDEISENKTLEIGYTANTSLGATNIQVEKDGNIYLYELCDMEQPKTFYVANDGLGVFNVSLIRNTNRVANDTFTVLASPYEYILYSLKTEFLRKEYFDIYYAYNDTHTGYSGYIRIIDERGDEIYGQLLSASTDWELQKLENVYVNNLGRYTIELGYVDSGNFYVVPNGRFNIEIISSLGGTVSINAEDDAIYLGETIHFYGKNYFYNSLTNKTKIVIEPLMETIVLTGQYNYHEYWTPQTIGTFTCKLYVGNTLYDQVTVSVSLEPEDDSSIFPIIQQPLGSIIGLIITMFCLLCPFIIGGTLHLKHSIHPFIYAISGGLGISISIVLGLFPAWIPLFILAGGIIVIVIVYLMKRGGD